MAPDTPAMDESQPGAGGSDVLGAEQGGTDVLGAEQGGTDELGPEQGGTDIFRTGSS